MNCLFSCDKCPFQSLQFFISIAICWQFVDFLLKSGLNCRPIAILASLPCLRQPCLQNQLHKYMWELVMSQPLQAGESLPGTQGLLDGPGLTGCVVWSGCVSSWADPLCYTAHLKCWLEFFTSHIHAALWEFWSSCCFDLPGWVIIPVILSL